MRLNFQASAAVVREISALLRHCVLYSTFARTDIRRTGGETRRAGGCEAGESLETAAACGKGAHGAHALRPAAGRRGHLLVEAERRARRSEVKTDWLL